MDLARSFWRNKLYYARSFLCKINLTGQLLPLFYYLICLMQKLIKLLLLSFFIVSKSNGQFFIEPIAGFQHDLNNKNFNLINTGVQFSFKKSRQYELIVLLHKSWGLPVKSVDAAYSANPAIPLMMNAAKIIKPAAVSIAIGHRITLAGKKSAHKLSALLFTGILFQRISVNYQYDKENYTILNPDRTLNRSGIYIAGGVEYMRQLKNARAFVQVIITTPPSGKESGYPASFKAMATLGINAGYSIPLKTNKK